MSNRVWGQNNSVTREVFKKNEQEQLTNKLRFLDNYNLWLQTRHVGMRLRVISVSLGGGSDVQFDGVVHHENERMIFVDVDFRTGAPSRVGFFRTRTMSQGYPRAGELFIAPSKEEAGLLAERLRQMELKAACPKIGDEQEFEFNPNNLELVRS